MNDASLLSSFKGLRSLVRRLEDAIYLNKLLFNEFLGFCMVRVQRQGYTRGVYSSAFHLLYVIKTANIYASQLNIEFLLELDARCRLGS